MYVKHSLFLYYYLLIIIYLYYNCKSTFAHLVCMYHSQIFLLNIFFKISPYNSTSFFLILLICVSNSLLSQLPVAERLPEMQSFCHYYTPTRMCVLPMSTDLRDSLLEVIQVLLQNCSPAGLPRSFLALTVYENACCLSYVLKVWPQVLLKPSVCNFQPNLLSGLVVEFIQAMEIKTD